MGPPAGSGGSPAPIDRPLLEFLQTRFTATDQVERATITDSSGHLQLRVELSTRYYPADVTDATIDVRWYTNDDFSIHYRDVGVDGSWECRWDRHPNAHNSRAHFHPPPNASTPGEDAAWPTEYRDVVRIVLERVEARIDDCWRKR